MTASGLTPQKRFMVRLSLVTGSTLATIVGAQSLIALDAPPEPVDGLNVPAVVIPEPDVAAPQQQATPLQGLLPVPTGESAQPSLSPTVSNAAPAITILRHPPAQSAPVTAGVPATSSTSPQQVSIQPPAPVELAPPAPVVVQAPAQVIVQQASAAPASSAPPAPVTRSSR
ncbi:MAG: hypothetical protein Kow0077_25300 [Anaerolineae bacterium]